MHWLKTTANFKKYICTLLLQLNVLLVIFYSWLNEANFVTQAIEKGGKEFLFDFSYAIFVIRILDSNICSTFYIMKTVRF